MLIRRRPALAGLAAVAVAGLSLATATRFLTAAPPPPRPEQWKKVDDAQNKGLPQTAIKELEPIIESAMAEKAYPEAIKAIAKKIALEGVIQGNKPEERITRLTAEIEKAPAEMRPVMHAVLANWYWHYFQQNRWRFVRRTQTTAPPGNDFTTWDLPRLFDAIDKQFTTALAAEKELKATPIGTYSALLEKGTVSDTYRPTLWDFLAFDALAFYSSPEQAGAQPQDSWEPEAHGPVLAPAADFLAWNPNPTETDSRKLKAVKLYQNLLTFHKTDADKTAYYDTDLHRLQFAYNASFGEAKGGRYKAALQDFFATRGDHELSAVARYRFAELLSNEGEKVEARAVALAGFEAFPESHGGTLCFNLAKQIEAPNVTVMTERVWADPMPPVRVKYRNTPIVHFRLYAADWAKRIATAQWRPENLTDLERVALLQQKPDHAWSAELPATPDYHDRTEDTPAPKDVKAGFYFLFACPDANFTAKALPVFSTDVWVSDLALVVRGRVGGAGSDGFVVKAKSGEPVPGAKVRAWTRTNQGKFADAGETDSDKDGKFTFVGNANNGYVLLAEAGGQQLGTGNEIYGYWGGGPRPYSSTVLFTDRALYRPGQTVRFKGIALRVDQSADNYAVLPNKKLTVRFLDPNGKEAGKADVASNDYGSFSGSFIAPRDRLTGAMSLRVDGDAPGYAAVQVEEYKRPQFLVDLDAPKEAGKLGGDVTLTGKASAYTGAALGGAKVRYRVVREVRYPDWFREFCWWRLPPDPRPAQEIAHGTAETAVDGTFSITFPAKPDRTVPEADEPTFRFTVTADVTDATGETRSASKSVTVGYTALAATVSAGDWQAAGEPVKLTVSIQTHDGVGQAAKGTVKVYALRQPASPVRADLLKQPEYGPRPRRAGKGGRPAPVVNDPKPDPSDPKGWAEADAVATLPFETNADGKAELTAELPAGPFRAVVESQDRFGKAFTAKAQLTVIDPKAAAPAVKVPNLLAAPKWSVEPDEAFTAVWGTGYDVGRAHVEVEHRGNVLQSYWTEPGRTQATVKQDVTEAMRGGFTLRVSYVRENRAYLETRHVDVPWTNKRLTVKWERFVSKLEPGQKETWTAVVSGPNAKAAVAEMVATLYDASLDQFRPHGWMSQFGVFRQDHAYRQATFENSGKPVHHVFGSWPSPYKPVSTVAYRKFPDDVTVNLWAYGYWGGKGEGGGFGRPMMLRGAMAPQAAAPPPAPGLAGGIREEQAGMDAVEASKSGADGKRDAERRANGVDKQAGGPGSAGGPDLENVSARSNLSETAFFFPHLIAGDDGTVRLEFTMPEALTKWKFLGFAHDKELRSGTLTGEAVTAKDLMVQPNPPRFLREGDVLEFTVRVSNQSDARQAGTARLTLTDARTGKPVTADLGVATPDLSFDVPPKESRTLAWRLTVPDGQGPVIYKVVGAAEKLSDGEEGMLPVLSRRVLVTESLPLPIRGKETKTFDFAKLKASGQSDTLRTQSLTVQMASNPAWYAVMALPYLMEFPHECSEQTFNRMYANALARHVARSDPKIRRVFDQWRNTPALDSPLEKNQDLKAVMLDETPWVRQADSESQARRNVGVLFDEVRLRDELDRAFRKLADMQHADGAWPWFPGGPPNDYITLYVTTGFGRLRHLGVTVDAAPAVKAVARLDGWADKMYRDVLKFHKDKKDDNHLTQTVALYLYGRSFFLKDQPVAQPHQEAVDYWLGQAKAHWLKLGDRQSQAHLALALKRWGDAATPAAIVNSVRERSVSSEELGMFWRDQEFSAYWFRAPVETQAMMIELFDEVAADVKAVEDCKVWLLKQKQTRDWKTTKATADAVYGLLLKGDNLLKSDALVEVALGGEKVVPELVEAGTGFYEQKFVRAEVKPEMGAITVTKTDPGVAWGGVHWQYLEDVSKVTPHDGTPLKLEKKLYRRTFTKKGPVLEPVAGTVRVGDEIVVRVVLRTDRDMEYVHLKDHRGSGTEPVNVLSKYKYQDGLAYYESTRDTATHFFIDYLPKGTYVFEYPVRVQHKGRYPTGLASAQCMYAPEFNSHSESVTLDAQ